MKTIKSQDGKTIINADCIAAVIVDAIAGRVHVAYYIRALDRLDGKTEALTLAKFLSEEQAIQTLEMINKWLLDANGQQCFHIPEEDI